MSNKRLIKSTGIISLATLTSRVLGFARDILIANFFGTTILAEAFVVSFRIPNLLRDLVGEGAANAAFVPVLTEHYTKHSKNDFWRLARSLLYILAFVLFIISACGVLLSPVIVRLIAPGFAADSEKLAMTIRLTRIMFPFIFLVGLVAYGMGVLNSINHFAVPAFGPALLNIAMILSLIYLCPSMGIEGLAVAVLAGGVLQIVSMGFVLHRKGFRLTEGEGRLVSRRRTRQIHPAIKKIWRLLVPRFFGSAVYQLSVIVDNVFASFAWIVGLGAPAALWYSYRLFHLPLALFGIALATVALPRMSREVVRNDISALKETINFSMRGVFMTLVPASLGLVILGRPIIRILFERGEFTSYSTLITQNALFFYSFGLFACGGIKILVNAFFSMGDTKTPVKVASVSFFVNLILNAVLMWPLKIGGLALATSIAATYNFLMLYLVLRKRIGDPGTKGILGSLVRILMASLCMGVFACIGGMFLERLHAAGVFVNIISVLAVIILSVAIYLISGLLLGVEEAQKFVKWVLKKD